MTKPDHIVYLDHAATTPMDVRVLEAMTPYFSDTYGNPSSFHSVGLAAKEAVATARHTIAALLGARDEEILFTRAARNRIIVVFGIPEDKRSC